MKNYRILIPTALVFVMILSVFSFVKDKKKVQDLYNAYIYSAEYCIKEQLLVDAVAYYQEAKKLKPSLSIDKAIIDCYMMQGNDVENMYEELLKDYPTEIEAYEFAIEYYISQEKYKNAYTVQEISIKRELESEKINQMMEEIRYYYNLRHTDYVEIGEYCNGYCIVKSKNEKYGVVGMNGGIALNCSYSEIGGCSEDLFAIIDAEEEHYWIDIQGNRRKNYSGEIAVAQLGAFTNGIFWAQSENGTYTYYNSENKGISSDFEDATNFADGVAAVLDGSWYLIDSNMQYIDNVPYSIIITNENKYVSNFERLFVGDSGGFYMIDITGNRISDIIYEDARLFIDGTAAAIKMDDKWGFVNINGELVIEPQYEDARSFSNGYAAVKIDNKWGFINTEKKLVVEPQFEEVRDFTVSGNCFVMLNGVWNLLSFYN